MATLTKKQIKSVEDFIKKLPDSIVKGNYEKWLSESREDGIITDEEMSKFVLLAINLPVEFQSFPQEFQHNVNMVSNEIIEPKKEDVKEKVKEVQKVEDKRIVAANKEPKKTELVNKKVIKGVIKKK